MRLLRRSEVDKALKEEQRTLVTRAVETHKILKEEEQKLQKIQAEHEANIEKLREGYDKEARKIAASRQELQQEIISLEERRKQLEFSVDVVRLREREDIIKTKEKELEAREKLYAHWKEELQAHSHEIDVRESHTEFRNRESQKQSLALQEKMNEMALVETSLSEISMQLIERSLQLDIREKGLKERERSFMAHMSMEEQAAKEIRSGFKKQQQKLQEDQRAVKDGYATLAAAREKILGRKT